MLTRCTSLRTCTVRTLALPGLTALPPATVRLVFLGPGPMPRAGALRAWIVNGIRVALAAAAATTPA